MKENYHARCLKQDLVQYFQNDIAHNPCPFNFEGIAVSYHSLEGKEYVYIDGFKLLDEPYYLILEGGCSETKDVIDGLNKLAVRRLYNLWKEQNK